MTKKIQVLHVFSGYGGGISSVILNLIENKTEDVEFDVMAFSYKNGEAFQKRLQAMGTECLLMPRLRQAGSKAFFRFLNETMRRKKYDAVHCHISGWLMVPFWLVARKHGVKQFFIHAHTTTYDKKIDRFPLVLAVDRLLNYCCATQYLTCSDLAANYIFGKSFLKKRPAYLIPNGVNEQIFSCPMDDAARQAYRDELKISEDTLVVLHVGRFSEPKNHDFILDIAKTLSDRKRRFVFLLVGSGERLKEIQDKTEQMGLQDCVKFLGRRDDVFLLMQFADCAILPSLFEGLPTVAVESQASGTPILISDTITRQCDMGMGLAETIPLGDANAWADGICAIAGRRMNLEQALTVVRKKGFTAREAGRAYCEEIKRIIGNKEV